MGSIFPLERGGSGRVGARLSKTLKALRRLRGLRPAEVARRMDLPLRSFEHFEAGRGRLDLARLNAFAEATDTDALAILAALSLDSTAFAVRCADNKLMTILMMSLADFDAAAGDDLARLAPNALLSAFRELFDALAAEARRKGIVTGVPEAPGGVQGNEPPEE